MMMMMFAVSARHSDVHRTVVVVLKKVALNCKRLVCDGHRKIVMPSKTLSANKRGAIIITTAAFQCHPHRGKVVMVVNCEKQTEKKTKIKTEKKRLKKKNLHEVKKSESEECERQIYNTDKRNF